MGGTRHEASKIFLNQNGIFVFLPKALKLAPSKNKKRIEEPKTLTKPKEFHHVKKDTENIESDHGFLYFPKMLFFVKCMC